MKKTLLNLIVIHLFLLTGLFNDSANGQVTNSESFDGINFLPAGWSSVGTSTLWSRRIVGTFPTCNNHSGAGMARFAARGVAAKTTQTIASPVFDLTYRGANTPKVSLWLYRDNGSTMGDSLSLYVNTSASLTSAVWIGTIARYSKLKMPDTVAANGWYQYTFNVPASFSSSTNYILFKGISEAGYNIHIDDVAWDEYPKLCTGTPTPGTITATNSIFCAGTGITQLTLNGQTTGFAGLLFQWKWSTSATGPFTNFGTNVTSISTGNITTTRYYKCVATCSYSSKSDSTPVKSIVVNANAYPLINVIPSTANYCQGSSVPAALKATSNTAKTFLWSPATGLNRTDISDVLASPAITTVYTVIGTDSIGCSSSVNVTVTLRQSPNVTLTATDSIMCNGDSVRLTATAGGAGNTFLWVPTGETTNIIFANPTLKTLYSVTVKNTFGCATTVSKNLFVIQKPIAKFGYKITGHKVNFYDSSTNATSLEWDFGDGNGSKTKNPVYIFVNDGNYSVKLIINNAPCKSDTLIKTIKITSTGIKEAYVSNGISIYPNPVKNLVKISIRENSNSGLVIYTILGEKVYSKTIAGNLETLDITELSSGIYNLVILNKGVVSNFRLVKVE